MQCPACSEEAPPGSVVCPYCAAPLREASAPGPADDAPNGEPSLDEAVTSAVPLDEAETSVPSVDEAEIPAPSLGDAKTSPAPPERSATSADPVAADAGPAAPARSRPANAGNGTAAGSSEASEHGRFLPGVTVADRYRIVGLLGRGGMGEVYRADDLKLGQQVALKFLTGDLANHPESVERLLDEVRQARKVAHPNVCRVWDIGETEGHHYVSMEYVDGEDLASLLRRIGRLPEDKAVEIARQLCAALAAAHEEGVLHRDLKPANIMLDGRGRVKLTDFGLAGVAEVRAGTPVYMAPEQLAGREVSVKSDLFSLGLVLHELLTGKRVFEADGFEELSRLHQDSMTTSLTTTSALDPAVDRIIHRCLEIDPAKRPASALAVAAGLPGADPLAAALAAGETPSPELVAEAGGEGSLPVAVAAPLLLAALVCAVAVGVLQARTSLVSQVPIETPPVLLDARAREIVEQLGYDAGFADEAGGYDYNLSYIQWLRRQGILRERWDAVRSGRPPSLVYWWRGSPETLVPESRPGPSSGATVSLSNPPRTTPGMVSLQLDPQGRLLWLDAVPDRVRAAGSPNESADWALLFDLMGLERDDFSEVVPRRTPEHFAGQRAAWEGMFPEDPETSLRIEAAALDGRPVSVRTFTAYDPLEPVAPAAATGEAGPEGGIRVTLILTIFIMVMILGLILTAIFGGIWVARRNAATGRGDMRGARRVGTLIAVALGIEWLLGEHTFSFNDIDGFLEMLIFVGAAGGLAWALYLAVEPFMRRHAPRALIGWTRLIDGRLSDPLVGRDVLLGFAAGAFIRLLAVVPMALGEPGETVINFVGVPFPSVTRLISALSGAASLYVVIGLALSFLFGLTFVLLRRSWWAAYILWLLFTASMAFLPGLNVNNFAPAVTTLTSVFWILGAALSLFVLFRLGILVYVAAGIASWLLENSLPTLDFSAWYGPSMIAGVAIFAAVVAFAFHRCVVWRGGLAEALAES